MEEVGGSGLKKVFKIRVTVGGKERRTSGQEQGHHPREGEEEEDEDEGGAVVEVAEVMSMNLKGLHQNHLSRVRIAGCLSKTQVLLL